MNPSKTVKTAVFALVLASATAGSFTASAESQTVTVSVPSVGTVVKGGFTLTKKILPYIAVFAYYAKAEPALEACFMLPAKTEDAKTEDAKAKDAKAKPDKPMQTGAKKIVDAFVGVFFVERVKEDAKAIDAYFSECLEGVFAAA